MSTHPISPWPLRLCWLWLALGIIAPGPAPAAEDAPAAGEEEVVAEELEQPADAEPEGSFYLGYRWVDWNDSPKAAEYQYPHSSLTLGIDTLACPLPHRYHLTAEYLNEKDFYADAGYAYKDLLLFRDILVGLHHNLDHFDYLYPGAPPAITYLERDPGDEYGLDYASNLFSLRLKAPDFPFHTFVRHRRVQYDGDIEQRFVSGSFSNLTKVSETRVIDWVADTVTLGANSHLGPVEAEYQYEYSEFDPGGHNVLYDYFPPSLGPPRPGDVYPHHVVPETESTGNTLKLHTAYTGGIVAAATLGSLEQTNNYSNTEAGVWRGAFDFKWLPDPAIGLFFKYRHKDLDLDQADMVQLAGAANVLNYRVRQGVSYRKDLFILSARYKPLASLSLLPSYEFATIDRKDIDEWWMLPETTDIHTLNLTAQGRPFDSLKLKGLYEYKYYVDPAYNTEPDSSNQLRLSSTYSPLPWLTAFLDYVLTDTQRSDLRYINSLPRVLFEGGERDGRSDRLTASLSAAVSPKVSVTGSWTYSRWDVEQDLAFNQWAGGDMPYIGYNSPYSDEANSYSLALQYLPWEDITINAEAILTVSSGHYAPDIGVGSRLPMDEYSCMDAQETMLTLEVAKKMAKDWEVGIKFYSDTYDDNSRIVNDGELFVTTLILKRYF